MLSSFTSMYWEYRRWKFVREGQACEKGGIDFGGATLAPPTGKVPMASGSTVTNNFISTLSGFNTYAEMLVGSNNAPGGTAEFLIGASATNNTTGRKLWDSDLTDGFDSGWVDVVLTMPATSGPSDVLLKVAGGNPETITYSGIIYSAITRVRIRAGVQAPAKMSCATYP